MASPRKPPRGGRKKGSLNKIKVELVETIADRVKRCVEDGLTPLEYLLGVMRDTGNDDTLRLEAAKSASSYVHKKQPQDVTVDAKGFPTPAPTFLVVNAPKSLPDDKRAD